MSILSRLLSEVVGLLRLPNDKRSSLELHELQSSSYKLSTSEVSSDELNDSADVMLSLSMFSLKSPSLTARAVSSISDLLTMVINFTGFGTFIFLAIIDVGYVVLF